MVKTFKTFLNFSCFVRHPVDLIEGGGGRNDFKKKCTYWNAILGIFKILKIQTMKATFFKAHITCNPILIFKMFNSHVYWNTSYLIFLKLGLRRNDPCSSARLVAGWSVFGIRPRHEWWRSNRPGRNSLRQVFLLFSASMLIYYIISPSNAKTSQIVKLAK